MFIFWITLRMYCYNIFIFNVKTKKQTGIFGDASALSLMGALGVGHVLFSAAKEELPLKLPFFMTGRLINQAENLAAATLSGIMDRESAITGKEVHWDEMMNSNAQMRPDTYAIGTVN